MKKEHAANKETDRNSREKPSRDGNAKTEIPPKDQRTPGEEGEDYGGGLRGA